MKKNCRGLDKLNEKVIKYLCMEKKISHPHRRLYKLKKYFPKFILHDSRLKESPQHRRIDWGN